MTGEKRDIWNNHSLWMILCCAIPLVGIVLLSFFGVLGAWGLYEEMQKGSSKDRMIGE
jgi:hypothetical protein